MEEKAKKKLTVKGLLKAFLVVLLILVILSLIIIFGGKGNKMIMRLSEAKVERSRLWYISLRQM